MKFSHRMTGHDELLKKLRALPGALQKDVLVYALMDAAAPMRSDAAALAPRSEDKGPHMADHIRVAETEFVVGGRVGPEVAAVAVGPEKAFFYAEWQEHGTAHHPAHPFMRPAFDANKTVVRKRLADSIWTVIKHAVGGSR